MTKNPLSVSYKDLISAAEERLKWMKSAYPGKVMQGSMTSWTATHNIAVQEQLVRLLKRFVKNPQLDLYNEVEKQR